MQYKLIRGHSLLLILLTELIAICLIVSCKFSFVSTVTLCLFNFLFASLIFHLNGSIAQKLALLTVGNAVGLFWNYLFFQVYLTLLSIKLDSLYGLILPLLNLMWVVPFWSLSLGLLPKMQTQTIPEVL